MIPCNCRLQLLIGECLGAGRTGLEKTFNNSAVWRSGGRSDYYRRVCFGNRLGELHLGEKARGQTCGSSGSSGVKDFLQSMMKLAVSSDGPLPPLVASPSSQLLHASVLRARSWRFTVWFAARVAELFARIALARDFIAEASDFRLVFCKSKAYLSRVWARSG